MGRLVAKLEAPAPQMRAVATALKDLTLGAILTSYL